jgi:hypothetical protein
LFLTGPLLAEPVFFLERTDRTKVEETLAWKSASSTGGPGPVSRSIQVPSRTRLKLPSVQRPNA